MAEQSFMERFGPRLVANGYPVLPIMPGTKKPGRWRGGAWSDYPDWTRHAARSTTEHELDAWRSWPDAGVGVACGPVVAIDIDITDPGLALEIERLARARLGDTPALRIGRAPKRLLVYRALEPFPGIRRAPLEVLGLGQQFVAHAIHPDTGRPYDWPEESLAGLDIGDLPAVDEAAVRAFLDEALALVPDNLKPLRLVAGPTGTAHSAHAQAGTFPAIREALAWIPNADLDYDSWVRIALALKGALGDAGCDLFTAWSAQSGKDDAAFTAKTWAGLKAERIGAGTIYHLAIKRGWRPDPSLVLDGDAPTDAVHPAAGLLAKVQVTDPGPRPPAAQPSFDGRVPEGILAEMVDYMVSTARRPQPLLSLGASLCALGALMGRKYRTETNLRSNLYIVGIADSGSGKNHAREIVNELFFEAGLACHLGGNKIASGAGLLTALHRQPALLLQIDEFGMFLAAAADRRRSPRHITEILDNMTELYTAAGSVFLGAEYANHDGRNERRDITQPCLCVYGTTTPLHFWNALQSTNVIDGSLARFIILPSEEDYPEEAMGRGIRTAPQRLVERLRLVAEGSGHLPSGNLAGLGAGTTTAVEPMTVPMTAEAVEAFAGLGLDITSALRKARGTPHTAMLARVSENAQKLALIASVSRDPVAPVISAGDAEWAIELVRHFVGRTMRAVEHHVADNEIERNHKKMLDIIRTAGEVGLTKTELTRKTQFLDRRTRDEAILTLTEAGFLTSRIRPSATKHTIVLVAIEVEAA
jgi:hypothetical protein